MALVGVGSELRADDMAGLLVARKLEAWCRRARCDHLFVFAAGAAPENISGEIIRCKPDCVVLVDAAHLPGLEPGSIELIPRDRVAGVSFSTHMLPASILLEYLENAIGCRSVVLGIQIEQKEILGKPSPSVERAVERLVGAFRRHFSTV